MGVQMVMSITLGEFVIAMTTVASATAAVVAVRWELKNFRVELEAFRGDLSTLSGKVEKQQNVQTIMFGQLQRLIGAMYPKMAAEAMRDPL